MRLSRNTCQNETLHQSEEVRLYRICCQQTGSQVDRFCEMFFEKRPIVNSSQYDSRKLGNNMIIYHVSHGHYLLVHTIELGVG